MGPARGPALYRYFGVGLPLQEDIENELLGLFDVAPVDRDVLDRALDSDFTDFEDAVLHEAAVAGGMSAIVTRDRQGFANATLPVFDPRELLAAVTAAAEQ